MIKYSTLKNEGNNQAGNMFQAAALALGENTIKEMTKAEALKKLDSVGILVRQTVSRVAEFGNYLEPNKLLCKWIVKAFYPELEFVKLDAEQDPSMNEDFLEWEEEYYNHVYFAIP